MAAGALVFVLGWALIIVGPYVGILAPIGAEILAYGFFTRKAAETERPPDSAAEPPAGAG